MYVVYVYIYACMFLFKNMHVYVCMYVCMYVRMCVYVCVSMYCSEPSLDVQETQQIIYFYFLTLSNFPCSHTRVALCLSLPS